MTAPVGPRPSEPVGVNMMANGRGELVKADPSKPCAWPEPRPFVVEPAQYRWKDVRVGDVIRDLHEGGGDMRVRDIDDDTAELYVIDEPWKTRRYHRSVWDSVSVPFIALVDPPRNTPLLTRENYLAALATQRREAIEWGSSQYWTKAGELAGYRTRGDFLQEER